MSATDHKAESLSIEVDRLADNANTADGRGIIAGLDALRHATLYLAEQQRIANVIELESMPTEQHDRLSINTSVTAIREGLGLS